MDMGKREQKGREIQNKNRVNRGRREEIEGDEGRERRLTSDYHLT